MDRIQELIERFANEIRAAALEEAVAGLEETLRRGGQRTHRGARFLSALGSSRRHPGAKRDPKELEAITAKLHNAIRTKPGLRIEQIATSMGTTTNTTALPARKLI